MQLKIDAAELLDVLEDVSTNHVKLVKALRSGLVRVRRDPANEEQQQTVLAGLRRLRVLRVRIARVLGGLENLRNVDNLDFVLEGPKEVVENAATLSEFMIAIAYPAEEEILRRTLLLAKKGAELLAKHRRDFEEDLEQIKVLKRALEKIVDKYYE